MGLCKTWPANEVHLLEKGKIFSRRLARFATRALNLSFWGRRTSIHPTHMMPRAWREVTGQHKAPEGQYKGIPASQFHQGPILKASMLVHALWGIKMACRAMTLLASVKFPLTGKRNTAPIFKKVQKDGLGNYRTVSLYSRYVAKAWSRSFWKLCESTSKIKRWLVTANMVH